MSAPQAGVGVGRGRGRGRGGNASGGGGGSGTGSRERGRGWYGRGTSKGRALAATPRGPSGRGDVPDSGLDGGGCRLLDTPVLLLLGI